MRKRPVAGTRPKTLRALLKPTAASLQAEAGMLMHKRERLERELEHLQQRSEELTTMIQEITAEVQSLRERAYAMEAESSLRGPTCQKRSSKSKVAGEDSESQHNKDDGSADSRFKNMVLDY